MTCSDAVDRTRQTLCDALVTFVLVQVFERAREVTRLLLAQSTLSGRQRCKLQLPLSTRTPLSHCCIHHATQERDQPRLRASLCQDRVRRGPGRIAGSVPAPLLTRRVRRVHLLSRACVTMSHCAPVAVPTAAKLGCRGLGCWRPASAV